MIRFTPHAGASLRLGLLASACALLIGCTTPVAVRSLSAELVLTQRTYAASLHSYFGAVEKFADAQQRIAEIRIDEIAHEINRQFGRRANGEMAGAATPEQRQRVIDQLLVDVADANNANLPLKRKIETAVASLKEKDRELESAYGAILKASEKLDEYIQLSKTNEVLIGELVRSAGVNSEKIVTIVDSIGRISDDLAKAIASARP